MARDKVQHATCSHLLLPGAEDMHLQVSSLTITVKPVAHTSSEPCPAHYKKTPHERGFSQTNFKPASVLELHRSTQLNRAWSLERLSQVEGWTWFTLVTQLCIFINTGHARSVQHVKDISTEFNF